MGRKKRRCYRRELCCRRWIWSRHPRRRAVAPPPLVAALPRVLGFAVLEASQSGFYPQGERCVFLSRPYVTGKGQYRLEIKMGLA
jgi:hypothetical protein